jgi:hypothetical protein
MTDSERHARIGGKRYPTNACQTRIFTEPARASRNLICPNCDTNTCSLSDRHLNQSSANSPRTRRVKGTLTKYSRRKCFIIQKRGVMLNLLLIVVVAAFDVAVVQQSITSLKNALFTKKSWLPPPTWCAYVSRRMSEKEHCCSDVCFPTRLLGCNSLVAFVILGRRFVVSRRHGPQHCFNGQFKVIGVVIVVVVAVRMCLIILILIGVIVVVMVGGRAPVKGRIVIIVIVNANINLVVIVPLLLTVAAAVSSRRSGGGVGSSCFKGEMTGTSLLLLLWWRWWIIGIAGLGRIGQSRMVVHGVERPMMWR